MGFPRFQKIKPLCSWLFLLKTDRIMKTKAFLELSDVKLIAAAAEAEAIKNNWAVCIAIVDDGGHLLWLQRLDGAAGTSRVLSERAAFARHAGGGGADHERWVLHRRCWCQRREIHRRCTDCQGGHRCNRTVSQSPCAEMAR